MWTHFWDMHSGGSLKEKWGHIYIEAPEEEAKVIFYNRFGHNPKRVTCTCCGEDYCLDSEEDLTRLTAFHRNCEWVSAPKEKGGGHYIEEPGKYGNYVSLKDYMEGDDALFICKEEIKPEERVGDIPEQGYIWRD